MQVTSWPLNPVDFIIASLSKMDSNIVVADMGCGDAKLLKELGTKMKIHSFDLVKGAEGVIECDIAHVSFYISFLS